MIDRPQKSPRPHTRVTLRAVSLGVLLIPVNTYFIMWNHLKYWSTLPTTLSLIYNVIITLTILVGFNFLIQRFLPRFALKHDEFDHLCDALSVIGTCGT